MKKSRITLLTCLLTAGILILSFLIIMAYKNIHVLSLRQTIYDTSVEQIKTAFYYIFISTAFTITIVVLLLRYYNKLHAVEANALAMSNEKVVMYSKRMDDILQSISDPFFTLDKDCNFIFLNSMAANELAPRSGALLGSNYMEQLYNSGQDIMIEKMNDVMQSRQSVSFEAKNNNGEWRDISIYPTSEGVSVQSKDAGKRKKFEEQLLKTQQLMDETNRVAVVGGWEIDMLAGTVSWTPVTYLIHEVEENVTPDLATGINYYKPGATREKITALVEHAIKAGEGWDAELEIITAKGNEKWIRTRGITDFKDGRCVRIFGTFQDIDEKKKMELRLKNKQAVLFKTQQLMDETNRVAIVGGWEIDMLAGTVSWTPVTYLIHEVEENVVPDLATGINYYKPGATREKITAFVDHAIKTGEGWDAELEIITAKGNEKWIRTKGITEFQNGRCVRVFGIFQDITLKKQAEERLIAERKLLQTIIDNLPMNVYVKDRQHRKVLVNSKEKEYLQVNGAAELLGKTDHDLYPAAHAQISVEEDKQVYETGIPILNLETVSVKFDGTQTHFLTSKIPYYDGYDHIEGLVGISYDITSIKEKESALKQANTALKKATSELAVMNEELDQFASMASHDLQEPLRVITGLIALIEKKYNQVLDDKGREYTRLIVDGALRMKLIITDILEYSRHGLADEDNVKLDLNNLVNSLVALNFSDAVSAGAVISYENMPVIMAQATSIKQLLINLISNALKYQQPGNLPVIQIRVKRAGGMWQFAVSDNGIGIKSADHEKVFKIFRRLHSRSEYSGTGIGLAICKRIVNKYKGEIWIDSDEGKGTTFYFTLPASLDLSDYKKEMPVGLTA